MQPERRLAVNGESRDVVAKELACRARTVDRCQLVVVIVQGVTMEKQIPQQRVSVEILGSL